MSAAGSSLAVQIVSVGGLVATASVFLTAILGVSRMAFSMARGKDLPSFLSRLHQKFGTPYYAIIVTGVVMSILVLFVDLTRVVALSTFALLFNYSITNISAYRLKTEHRKYHRAIHLIGLATCILLISFIVLASTEAAVIGAVFLCAGAIYYFARAKIRKR
jgi:APA family basic amino acid/polyamine antiporter